LELASITRAEIADGETVLGEPLAARQPPALATPLGETPLARRRKDAFQPPNRGERSAGREPPALRIIGGAMRGRKLLYSGDQRTRPMKDRVREAVFNLLGPAVAGKHAIDLFAGTGALAFEAISRGAARGTFIEQHFPTARLIRQNAVLLGIGDRAQIHSANTFIWIQKNDLGCDQPWLVFCSPPYAFYVERHAQMLALIATLLERAPPTSILVVEADDRFDTSGLSDAAAWEIRKYPPAVVAIYRK
jgi:16S rRNA (guanine966-N2)-methyltransferase